MKIVFVGPVPVNGHRSLKYQVQGLEVPVEALITWVRCRCGGERCSHGDWALSIAFPNEFELPRSVIAEIKRRLLPHVPMKVNLVVRPLDHSGSRTIGIIESDDQLELFRFSVWEEKTL